MKKSIYLALTIVFAFLLASASMANTVQASEPSDAATYTTEYATKSTEETESPPNIEQDHPLVGTWTWDMSDSYVYIFNANGTGTRGFENYIEEFTWQTTVQNNLGIITSTETESWRYVIDGSVLTLDSLRHTGTTFSYIRDGGIDTRTPPQPVAQDENSPLIGIWGMYFDTSFVQYFNADGTGFYGFPGNLTHFTWTVEDDNLRITIGTALESWSYYVIDDALIINSLQLGGVWHGFVRLNEFPEAISLEMHPLVGTWFWDIADYVRIFDGDGTGYSGFAGELQPIIWTASDTNMHIAVDQGPTINWFYQIEGDVLTISSPYQLGLIYSYIKDGGEDTRTPPLPIVAPRNHPLIGTWHWEEGRNFGYTFNANGTGTMYSPDETVEFTWIIAGIGNLRITVDTIMYSWEYEIDEDTLFLQSILLTGWGEYVYVRQTRTATAQ